MSSLSDITHAARNVELPALPTGDHLLAFLNSRLKTEQLGGVPKNISLLCFHHADIRLEKHTRHKNGVVKPKGSVLAHD